jgi:hypothetical protein
VIDLDTQLERLAVEATRDAVPPSRRRWPAAAGAATLGGYWFGKIDASVCLKLDVTPAQRQAIPERIERLDVVDQTYFLRVAGRGLGPGCGSCTRASRRS